MRRYGITDLGQQEVDNLLRKYPELLTSLATYSNAKFKCEGRVLRRDTERRKWIRKYRRQPDSRLKRFESAIFRNMDMKTLLFVCPICRNLLKGPVTVECGHTFCANCLSADNCCSVCNTDLMVQNRCVNVLVQEIVEKWRERNRAGTDSATTVPDTADILGIAPRYQLRSGYAGLHFDNGTEDKISNFLHDATARLPRTKTTLNTDQIGNNSFPDLWMDEAMDDYKHFDDTLDSLFKEVANIREEALKTSWDCISISDLECILCSRCLLDPVTTSCGHTFCRGCLTRVLDHGLACPLCMASLSVTDYARGSTDILRQAIQFLVPEDFNERVSLNLKETLISERSSDIPVFVCTNAFPGVACPLYVYEPRYRLLARRCLQCPTKRFAMAGKESNENGFVQYGTVLEVKDAVSLQDGRFILTTVGIRRYKVVSSDEKDGYDTAQVQYIRDVSVSAEKLPELVALHAKVYNKASKWIRSLKPKVLAEVERLIGLMPDVEHDWASIPDGPSWAWWLMPILPLSSQLQVGFLSTTSLEKRLRAIDKMLEHMKIRMKALERNTVACPQDMDSMDTCSETERSFELPFTNT